jgi:hypothetical protein
MRKLCAGKNHGEYVLNEIGPDGGRKSVEARELALEGKDLHSFRCFEMDFIRPALTFRKVEMVGSR